MSACGEMTRSGKQAVASHPQHRHTGTFDKNQTVFSGSLNEAGTHPGYSHKTVPAGNPPTSGGGRMSTVESVIQLPSGIRAQLGRTPKSLAFSEKDAS